MECEKPTQCPDCGLWEVYDYNGMPVCCYCYTQAMKAIDAEDWRTETPEDMAFADTENLDKS